MLEIFMNRIRKAVRLAVLFPLLALHGQIFVTNTNDSGPGSLRQAIQDGNTTPGAIWIEFHIPKSDPGFNADKGVWTIKPLSGFPMINCDAIEFKGETQSAFIGEDTNPLGPEIEIDGSLAGDYMCGIYVIRALVANFYLLTINRFHNIGIYAKGVSSGYIAGCYVGTDPTGMERAGNGYGVSLDSCRHFNVTSYDTVRTVISGNVNYGLGLVYGSRKNHVYGNFIGLNRTGTDTIGNGNYGGIRISDRSDSNLVLNNAISGNKYGVYLFNASGNTITQNTIGGPPAGLTGTWSGGGNRFGAVIIAAYGSDVSERNQLDANVISGNGGMGVRVIGTGSRYNMIYRNGIFANESGAINLEDGANEGITSPVIEDFNGQSVSGTAAPNAFVQLFTDDDRQAKRYLDYTGTDGQGRFNVSLSGQAPLANFTALVTDARGNSSYLSRPFAAVSGIEAAGFQPSGFRLDPVYPNPFNPSATVRFSLDRPCRVRLTVLDPLGRTVTVLADDLQDAGIHTVKVDASSWPSGTYFIHMEAGENGWSKTLPICVMK